MTTVTEAPTQETRRSSRVHTFGELLSELFSCDAAKEGAGQGDGNGVIAGIVPGTGDGILTAAMEAIARSAVRISENLRLDGFGCANTVGNCNKFGDEQLRIDMVSDTIICEEFKKSNVIYSVSSEENPEPRCLDENKEYSKSCPLIAAFDPLDGSSVIATNFAVGSIFALWNAPSFKNVTGNCAVAAAAAVYGPRTTLFITGGAGSNVWEITLPQNVAELSESRVRQVRLDRPGKLFAPANLRACVDNKGYGRLVSYYMDNRYTLRYTGGMVPDVTQLLIKGYGVFASPVSENAPAKLRLLYEGIPMALLIENAGGASSDGTKSLLNVAAEEYEQRTPVCLGSCDEVKRFEQFVTTA